MAHLRPDSSEISARLLYWGVQGAGVTTNLRSIHGKLNASNRGELRSLPTRLDPTVSYEMLPIALGKVNGFSTQLQVIGVPGEPEQAPTRKQLLDRVDGIVLVLDASPGRADENVAAVDELREALDSYGRSLEELPLVAQYNKRDLADPYQIEELHRRLALGRVAVFEAVASEGTGVLQTLTTVSKRVVRVLRDSQLDAPPAPEPEPAVVEAPVQRAATPEPAPAPPTTTHPTTTHVDLMERAILAEGDSAGGEADVAGEAERALDRPWPEVEHEAKVQAGARIGPDFQIVSVGTAERDGVRSIRVPLVLGNPEGETVTLALSIGLDPLLEDETH